jgi:hypothetical protein
MGHDEAHCWPTQVELMENGKFPKVISSSWNTRKKGAVPELLQGIGTWQWTWHNGNSKGYLSLTRHALSKCLKG